VIKILFVDDEVNLLDGLNRMLRKKKDDWDMTFIKSGKEALALMESNRYDIIVTDYKMPEMDGLKLLSQIKDSFAGTKRIILSGQSELEIVNKSREIAHAYLSKPCGPDELISVIENKLNI
jgi:YesN/AraC family two-component response regulator